MLLVGNTQLFEVIDRALRAGQWVSRNSPPDGSSVSAFSNTLKLNSWGTIPICFFANEKIFIDIDAEIRTFPPDLETNNDNANGCRFTSAIGAE